MSKEIPQSKFDVTLFRRFPDDDEKEKDYGPGYLKLYLLSGNHTRGEENDGVEKGDEERKKVIQIVFRSNGTMKVRAAHKFNNPEEVKDTDKETGRMLTPNGVQLDTSFERELRYVAVQDYADMLSQRSDCYGQKEVTSPVNFPLSFQFETDENRDKFVVLLREQVSLLHSDESKCDTRL
mmetsp:Transcript_2434/g.6398  ORF Transcript_2434/g.6398 Transcript_2434/m.6398 type:complete len:180 (-) Transcript_2434:615-1154(-)